MIYNNMEKEKFLERVKNIHKDYNYKYYINGDVKSHDYIEIKCRDHDNRFKQKVYTHLNGSTGCKECYTNKITSKNKITKSEFIERSNRKHGNIYDYTKVNLIDSKTKVEVVCKEHGSFFPTPSNHMMGSKCPKCSIINKSESQKITFVEFIERSNNIYHGLYQYTKPGIFDYKLPIKAICKKHGEFILNPERHITKGQCCTLCTEERIKISKDEFIESCNKIHNYKYNYELVNYKTLRDKVKIICPSHGIFEKNATHHIHNTKGCPECSRLKKLSMNIHEFIKISNKTFNNKYDYSKSIFKNKKSKIEIICPLHGQFSKRPIEHINGSGCPICKESKGEIKIRELLNKYKVNFISQKEFEGCEYKKNLKFDFYIPKFNSCIEYDGPQHSEIIETWGGIKKLKETQIRDNIKNKFCTDNKIDLLRIKFTDYKNIENILAEYYSLTEAKKAKQPKVKVYKKTRENKINELISKCQITHNFKYKYIINVNEYKNINSHIEVLCPIHGSFIQRAYTHLNYGIGCKKCDEFKYMNYISHFLDENDIRYYKNHNIDGLIFNYYLPKTRTIIEFDGRHHFEPIDEFGGLKTLNRIREIDKIKKNYCEDNYINLIRIKYNKIDDIYQILWENLKR